MHIFRQLLPHFDFAIYGVHFGTPMFACWGMCILLGVCCFTWACALTIDRLPFEWMYPFNFWFGRIAFWVCLYSDLISTGGGFSILMAGMLVAATQSYGDRFAGSWLFAIFSMAFWAKYSGNDFVWWFVSFWVFFATLPSIGRFIWNYNAPKGVAND